MPSTKSKSNAAACPLSSPSPSVADVKSQLQKAVDDAVAFCLDDSADKPKQATFFSFEKGLAPFLMAIGRLLIRLFLVHRHAKLDLKPFLEKGTYRVAEKDAERTLKTAYGDVAYQRAYLAPCKKGIGFHPLDMMLGLTRDALSPFVIQFVCALATRMSFGATRLVCKMAIGWTPAQETIENAVLGMGRRAAPFVEQLKAPENDGDVLVILIDGKCAPTATDEELKKRRGKRSKHKKGCSCGCQRHRGKGKRKVRGSKKRRKRGDKSKNGKEVTVVVMFTLKRGEDGKLHGPINKKVWATFAGRLAGVLWARSEATKRGFGPETAKTVQILMDGAKSLRRLMKKHFPNAILTLDVYHVVERLWALGRHYHKEGSNELQTFVEDLKEYVYSGRVSALVKKLKRMLKAEPRTGPGTKGRRTGLATLIGYLRPRLAMMNYAALRKQDLEIGSGQVEGAVRHVVGQRLDCGGMRWVREKAEPLLHLRCIMINGDWEAFANWHDNECLKQLRERGAVRVLTDQGVPLPRLKKKLAKKAA